MSRAAWVLTLLLACSGNEEVVKPEPTPPSNAAPSNAEGKADSEADQPEVEAAPDPAEQLRAAVLGGSEGSLAQVQEQLAAAPTEDGLWRMLAYAASDAPREAYDQLDAGAAIGGRVGPHHILRAELALASGLPAEALKSAQSAASEASDEAIALTALAVKAGAEAPAMADPPSPSDRLVSYVVATRSRDAQSHAEEARQVAGWRASLARAEADEARGDLDLAFAEYATAAEGTDPRAVVAGNIGRARLSMTGKLRVDPAPTPANVHFWAATAARTAAEDGDGVGALEAQALAVAAATSMFNVDESLTLASELASFLLTESSGDRAAELHLAHARAAEAAGHPSLAGPAGRAAMAAAADASLASQGAWIAGRAAYELGVPDDIREARGKATGAHADALDGLLMISEGKVVLGLAALPSSGLTDRESAFLYMEAAQYDRASAAGWAKVAVQAADRSGDAVLRVQTRLALEEALRVAGSSRDARVRSELLGLAPAGEAGAGLRAEVGARAALAGQSADIPVVAGGPQGSWAGTGGEGPWHDRVSPFLKAWASGDGDGAASGMAGIALHRQGLLRTSSVLDGSAGMPVAATLEAIGETQEERELRLVLAAHELHHRWSAHRADLAVGVDVSAGLPEDDRTALLGAAARLRATVGQHLAGGGPWPVEDVAAYEKAEEAAGATQSFGRTLPAPAPSLEELRSSLSGAVLLSYAARGTRIEGLVLSPSGGSRRYLGDEEKILGWASGHFDAMQGSADAKGRASHVDGDRLRATLVDPFTDVLSGYGRYQVVAPDGLLAFPFTTFPEQANGLRWLADIRTVAVASRLRDLSPPIHEISSYKPDFLAVGEPVSAATGGAGGSADAAAAPEPDAGTEGEGEGAAAGEPAAEEAAPPEAKNEKAPAEGGSYSAPKPRKLPRTLSSAARHFGSDFREVLMGQHAEAWRYRKRAPRARYLYIVNVPMSDDGGFVLADEDLSINELRTTPLAAELVVIAANAPPAIQAARARAMMDAGAAAVIVWGWAVPEMQINRVVDAFFEAVNRDRAPARALGDARQALLTESMGGEDPDDPAVWGAAVLFGSP